MSPDLFGFNEKQHYDISGGRQWLSHSMTWVLHWAQQNMDYVEAPLLHCKHLTFPHQMMTNEEGTAHLIMELCQDHMIQNWGQQMTSWKLRICLVKKLLEGQRVLKMPLSPACEWIVLGCVVCAVCTNWAPHLPGKSCLVSFLHSYWPKKNNTCCTVIYPRLHSSACSSQSSQSPILLPLSSSKRLQPLNSLRHEPILAHAQVPVRIQFKAPMQHHLNSRTHLRGPYEVWEIDSLQN